MSLVEDVQEILDERYPELRIEVRSSMSDRVYISINLRASGCILGVGSIDAVVKECLKDLKYLVECDLEEIDKAITRSN